MEMFIALAILVKGHSAAVDETFSRNLRRLDMTSPHPQIALPISTHSSSEKRDSQ
jgi:hypothetical protein